MFNGRRVIGIGGISWSIVPVLTGFSGFNWFYWFYWFYRFLQDWALSSLVASFIPDWLRHSFTARQLRIFFLGSFFTFQNQNWASFEGSWELVTWPSPAEATSSRSKAFLQPKRIPLTRLRFDQQIWIFFNWNAFRCSDLLLSLSLTFRPRLWSRKKRTSNAPGTL